MRRVFLSLLAGLVLCPAASREQDSPARACDLAAASPYDATRPSDIPGVSADKVDPKIALPACKAALSAEPENVRLLYQMGRALEVANDYNQASAFYERAAAHGHAGAQYNLAGIYVNGLGGMPKSDENAVRLFKLAADEGFALAQSQLGYFHASGQHGLAQDDREAARLFKLAADQGLAQAQYNLALDYMTGRGGLPKSDEDAVRLFKLAADQGMAQAQYNLALYYVIGRGGLEKNDREAARLFMRAADQGYGPAQGPFENVFASVGRSPQGDRKVVRGLRHAASRGNADALYRLGILYETGLGGIPRNIQEAERLYDWAANRGQGAARAELVRLVAEGLNTSKSDAGHGPYRPQNLHCAEVETRDDKNILCDHQEVLH